MGDPIVNVAQIPIAARWTLYALGAVDGQRVRRPRDPVAAWLLRRQPTLLPPTAIPSVLTMIRARTSVVDRMIEEEVARARADGSGIAYWGFASGFDARWYRLLALVGDVIRSHREVDDADVLALKSELLAESTFARQWTRIRQHRLEALDWAVESEPGTFPLVVLEGAATRLGIPALKAMLGRIREATPTARVIVDLPGVLDDRPPVAPPQPAFGRGRWGAVHESAASAITTRDLRLLGWRVVDDTGLCARPELRGPSGSVICAGMEALRVLRLEADVPPAKTGSPAEL